MWDNLLGRQSVQVRLLRFVGAPGATRMDREARLIHRKDSLELLNRISQGRWSLYWWPLGDLNELLGELIEHVFVLGEASCYLGSLLGERARARRRLNKLRSLVGELDCWQGYRWDLRLGRKRIGLD